MKEEDSELSHDIAENTQVCFVSFVDVYIYIYIFFFLKTNFWCMFAEQVMHMSTLIQQDALSCTGLALSNFDHFDHFFVASF